MSKTDAWKYAANIVQMYKRGWSVKALAIQFDVSTSNIYNILHEYRQPTREQLPQMPIAEKHEEKVYVTPPKVTYDGVTYNDLTKWFLESNYYEPVLVKRV